MTDEQIVELIASRVRAQLMAGGRGQATLAQRASKSTQTCLRIRQTSCV